jgi:malate/lactate dehydrogenase
MEMFNKLGVVSTVDVKTAFEKIDYCIMVGAFPRLPGMERKDLLQKNAGIFKEQGKALSDYANRNVKVNVTHTHTHSLTLTLTLTLTLSFTHLFH